MTRVHNPRVEDEEAAPASQCRFGAMETLDRFRGLLPTVLAQPASSDSGSLPATSKERRRASVVSSSLDQDEHLPEKIVDQQESGTAVAETATEEETVLYLAYGSNLAQETFRGVRKIKPLSQIPVLVPELRLTFDLPGLPYAEPCFAGTQYRNPSAPGNLDSELGDDVSLVPEEEVFTEKAPLMAETREARESDYHKNRWHKPLVGVVYEVTLADYAKIIATEGGGRGYRDVVVDCHPFSKGYKSTDPVPAHPDTPAFKAHTLLSPAADDARRKMQGMNVQPCQSQAPRSRPCLPGRFGPHLRPDPSYAQPSARYLNLLITGAAEHDLPVSYREYLSQIRPYRITTTRQKLGKGVFVGLWGPMVLSILALSKMFAGPDGRSPPWLVLLADVVWEVMWSSYDSFFKKAFGDGERTLEDTPPT